MDLETELEKLTEQGRELGILQARRAIAAFIMQLDDYKYTTKEIVLKVLQMEIPDESQK